MAEFTAMKKGALFVFKETHSYTTQPYKRVEYDRYGFGRVVSATKDGKIKKWRDATFDFSHGREVPRASWLVTGVDEPAVISALKERGYGNEFESLEAVRDFLRPFKRA